MTGVVSPEWKYLVQGTENAENCRSGQQKLTGEGLTEVEVIWCCAPKLFVLVVGQATSFEF